jgi:hypothetical protein
MRYAGKDIGKGVESAMRQLFGKRAENGVPVLEAPTRIVTPSDPDFYSTLGNECFVTIQSVDMTTKYRGYVTNISITMDRDIYDVADCYGLREMDVKRNEAEITMRVVGPLTMKSRADDGGISRCPKRLL